MKTYLHELRGQVRGNARLRRRLDAQEQRILRLTRTVQSLVTLLDKLGHGDDREVVMAAAMVGWERMRDPGPGRAQRATAFSITTSSLGTSS